MKPEVMLAARGPFSAQLSELDRAELRAIDGCEAQHFLPPLDLVDVPAVCAEYYLSWARAFRRIDLIHLEQALSMNDFVHALGDARRIRDGWFWFDLPDNLSADGLAYELRRQADVEMASAAQSGDEL